jgi:hypothetical protein
MDTLQWYPTPTKLGREMWNKFKNRKFTRVLEPQAGEGDLADCRPGHDRFTGHPVSVDCCEIDITHHEALRKKGYAIVGLDFLSMGTAAQYSHCIMNPPFATGADHVLHAWDIMWDGEIVALLNAETLRNPFSAARKRLVMLLERHGEVSFCGVPFADAEAEARRRADVECAIVYLRKGANLQQDIVGEWLSPLVRDCASAESLSEGHAELRELALPANQIENAVRVFDAAVGAAKAAVLARATAAHYSRLLGKKLGEQLVGNGAHAVDDKVEVVQRALNDEYAELKDRAWANILSSSQFTERLSSGAVKRLHREFEQIKQLEFTTTNIYGFLLGVVESQPAIQEQMAMDVFDEITRYHSDNTVFYRGWKSNDKHRTCGMRIKTTRFILPGHGSHSYQRSPNYETLALLADFDKVFAMLDGKRLITDGLEAAMQEHFDALRAGARVSSRYFDLRYYPGIGTLHFFCKDQPLMDRLNRMVGRKRRWLPPEDGQAHESFWLQFERAEKLDRSFRLAVKQLRWSSWRNPIHVLVGAHGSEEQARAADVLDETLEKVQSAAGISVDFRLMHGPAVPALPLAGRGASPSVSDERSCGAESVAAL